MSDINAKVVEIVVERLNVGADTVTAESSFKRQCDRSIKKVLGL